MVHGVMCVVCDVWCVVCRWCWVGTTHIDGVGGVVTKDTRWDWECDG